MKTASYLISLAQSTAIPLLAAIMTACGGSHLEPKANTAIGEITDTLQTGNLAKAKIMTEKLKQASLLKGDSATWCEAMVQQGVNAYYEGNPELLLASADSAKNWLEHQKPSRKLAQVLAKAYQAKGAYYDQYYFNPDSTAYYFRKAVDNVERSGIQADLPQAYGNYANALRMGASLDSAAIYYHKAITVADSLKLTPIHYIPLYNGIAGVFTDMRDFENSEIWWNKSMEIFESMNQFDKFNTLTGYGNHLYYKEDYESAQKVFKRLRSMLDSVPGATWESMFTDVNVADTFIRTGRVSEATEMLDSAARYFTIEQPNPMVSSYIHTLQMRAATARNDFEYGLNLAKAYPEADTLRLEQHLARLKALEELYSNTGNYRLAYATRSRYEDLNDSLRSDKVSQRLSTLNAMYQRDQRILNLKADTTRQQARIYRQLTVIAFTIAVIIGLVLFFVVRRSRIRRREERMMNKIVSLRQENLRNRVTPHFIYNALNHELHNKSAGKESHLDSLVHLIRRQQAIASEMLIPFSEELKFVDDYVKVIGDNGRDPLDYRCTIEAGIDTGFMFPSMTLQILVENAFKHGFPTLAAGERRILDISITRDDGRISVAVFNNRGHEDSHAESSGTGLRVLVETIKIINEHNRDAIRFKIDTDSEQADIHGCTAIITLNQNLKP